MYCTNCGASNKKDSKFCINCAESFSEVQIGERLSRTRVLKNASYLKKIDFLRTLFDFSFSQFVGLKIVKLQCLLCLSLPKLNTASSPSCPLFSYQALSSSSFPPSEDKSVIYFIMTEL